MYDTTHATEVDNRTSGIAKAMTFDQQFAGYIVTPETEYYPSDDRQKELPNVRHRHTLRP